jgi:hypothetical protein
MANGVSPEGTRLIDEAKTIGEALQEAKDRDDIEFGFLSPSVPLTITVGEALQMGILESVEGTQTTGHRGLIYQEPKSSSAQATEPTTDISSTEVPAFFRDEEGKAIDAIAGPSDVGLGSPGSRPPMEEGAYAEDDPRFKQPLGLTEGARFLLLQVGDLIKDGDLEAARSVRQTLAGFFSGIDQGAHREIISALIESGTLTRIIEAAQEESAQVKLNRTIEIFQDEYERVFVQPLRQALMLEASATRQAEIELTINLYAAALEAETLEYIDDFNRKLDAKKTTQVPGAQTYVAFRDELIRTGPVEFIGERRTTMVSNTRPDLSSQSMEGSHLKTLAADAHRQSAIRVRKEIMNRRRFSDEMRTLQSYVDSLRTSVDLDIADPQIRSRLDGLYQTLQLRQDALEDDYISEFEANPNLTPRQYISDQTKDDFRLALSGSRYEDAVGDDMILTISNILKVPGEVREEIRLAPLSEEDALALIEAGIPVDERQARDLLLQAEAAQGRLSAAEIAAGGRRLMPAMEEPVLDTPAIVAQREKVRRLQDLEHQGAPEIAALADAQAELDRLVSEVTPVPGEIERERPAVEVAPTDTPELQAARADVQRFRALLPDVEGGIPPDIMQKILRGEAMFGEEARKYRAISSAYRARRRAEEARRSAGGDTPGEQVAARLAFRERRAADKRMREEVAAASREQEEAAYQEASRKAIAGITPQVEREQEEAEEKRERELKAAKPFTRPARVRF